MFPCLLLDYRTLRHQFRGAEVSRGRSVRLPRTLLLVTYDTTRPKYQYIMTFSKYHAVFVRKYRGIYQRKYQVLIFVVYSRLYRILHLKLLLGLHRRIL